EGDGPAVAFEGGEEGERGRATGIGDAGDAPGGQGAFEDLAEGSVEGAVVGDVGGEDEREAGAEWPRAPVRGDAANAVNAVALRVVAGEEKRGRDVIGLDHARPKQGANNPHEAGAAPKFKEVGGKEAGQGAGEGEGGRPEDGPVGRAVEIEVVRDQ